ncbi:MAG: hypothetical protein QF858_04105 [Candidatus Pacebacteria bacterium]|jgi:hypothetical protein|nr:hypothetical protein [Candidatus Paceibacterota bacterium]
MVIPDPQHLIVFIQLVYDDMDKYGLFLLTNDQEPDPAWVAVTQNEHFWDFFYFGTFKNPPKETME